MTQRDVGLAGDHRRARVGLRGFDRGVDLVGVVAVDALHMPAGGSEAGGLVGDVGHPDVTVDGDVVVVEEHDQVRQLLHAGQADSLLADTFHQAAVTGHDVGVMVDDLGAPGGALDFLGDGEADGIADALAQRAGRDLDPLAVAVFGVARRAVAPLAEIANLVEVEIRVARQVQQGIKQHGPVPGREDEPVAV